jgi:hypothetical protein
VQLYDRWTASGDDVLTQLGRPSPSGSSSTGRLVTEALPFDYSQFGSLPGVA